VLAKACRARYRRVGAGNPVVDTVLILAAGFERRVARYRR
jgi:hypothetical protein